MTNTIEILNKKGESKTMPTEFDFVVSERLKKQFPELCHKYHAEEIDNDTYKITWLDGNTPETTANWSKREVEDNVYNNHWIIKEQ
jgi:asparagine synthetase A